MDAIDAGRLEASARHLPKPVQTKLHRLIDDSHAAWAGLNLANQSVEAANADWLRAEDNQALQHKFTRTMGADGRPIYASGDKLWLADAAPRLLQKWEAYQRSKVNIAYLSDRWSAYDFLEDIRLWLPENRRFSKHVPGKGKGSNHVDAVSSLRDQIADVDRRYADVDYAPNSVEDLIARADREVDRLAMVGAVDFDARSREGSPVTLDWPKTAINRPVSIQPEKLVWLFRDEIKEKLARLIRSETPANTMSDRERAAGLSSLEAEKLKLEREEEFHISAAAELGQFIPRRRDANPLAILEIA